MEVAERSEAERAQEAKDQGNALYKEGKYAKAIDSYSKAIGACATWQPRPL